MCFLYVIKFFDHAISINVPR
ncbi:hypothetical protein Gotri_024135, partial [Gossypium trilobum]|nr:hypothetical protein [Gossypium trilobum]